MITSAVQGFRDPLWRIPGVPHMGRRLCVVMMPDRFRNAATLDTKGSDALESRRTPKLDGPVE